MFHTIYHTFLLQQNLFFETHKNGTGRDQRRNARNTSKAHAVRMQ